MATAPTVGIAYITESDSVDNDDWITDHAGDPGSMDLDQFTEGTEYCYFDQILNIQKRTVPGVIPKQLGNATAYTNKKGYRFYIIILKGRCYTKARYDNIMNFFMLSRHWKSTSYKPYYFHLEQTADDYEEFVDEDDNVINYCPVVLFPQGDGIKDLSDSTRYKKWDLQLQLQSVFS